MHLLSQPLKSKNQTGRAIYKFVEKFSGDIGPLAKLSLPEFFDLVRKIPYKRDERGREWIVRPKILFSEFPAMDCKKKSLLIMSWLKQNAIPSRALAVSEMPSKKIHHVFPQGLIGGKWRNIDATYSKYKLFAKKPRVTYAEILKP